MRTNKKTKAERVESIMIRYQKASVRMMRLPGPNTGIYGTGHDALDRAYSIASSQMKRGRKVWSAYPEQSKTASAKASQLFPY